ncbi:MAG: ABC transporter substrate-binding protein [Leifsonia sp.]|uniref:ABC transporter substrate-binding protein n=1 Tax=Leifsonia sp. TaxID=1870902 RepID=UPI003F806CE8
MAHRSLVAAGAAALLLTLTACAGGGSAPGAADTGGAQKRISIKVVEGLAYDAAPLWVAKDKGFFDQENLDVTAENAANGVAAEAVPLIVGGSYQAGITTLGVTAQSAAKRLDFRIFGITSSYADTEDASQIAMVAKKDGPASLGALGAGDTVGVPGAGGPAQAYISYAIDKAGGDSKAVKFQNVPITQGAQLVKTGSLTASFITEPALTQVLDGDGSLRIIGYPTVEAGLQGTPATAFGATKAWIDSAAAPRFLRAIDKAITWVNDKANYDELTEIIAKHVDTDVAVVRSGRLPTFTSTIDEGAVDRYFAILKDYGVVPNVVTASDIISTPR